MTQTITNNTIKNIDFDDKNHFKIIYDDFQSNIDECSYNAHEKNFFRHFIKLYDEQQFNQFIIDYFYILKLYDDYKNNQSNDFFDDIYIINNIDFYDDVTNAIFEHFDNNIDVACDDISTIMQFDKNDVCDALFDNIVNN